MVVARPHRGADAIGRKRRPREACPPNPPPKLLPAPDNRQLGDLSRHDLDHIATSIGLDPTRYKSRRNLVTAIHAHRQTLAALDREALADVLLWAHRPFPTGATNEQLAEEVARIRTMRFAGLSHRGLLALARVRGVPNLRGDEPVPVLVRKLRHREGLFARLSRKRRAILGAFVARMVGEDLDAPAVPRPVSPAAGPGTAQRREPTIKESIEESGLIGGLTDRLKKAGDSYINEKLDEIEARIDRKLDEIDRRLAEWRDKEIANRLRILKITLWASVAVSAASLLYLYIKVYFVGK